MHKVTIYTDGGCSKNPGGDGAFAAMLLGGSKKLSVSGYIPAPTTNNRAEMAAVIEALTALKSPCEVEFICDSLILVYILSCRGKPDHKRGNRDMLTQIRRLSIGHKITARWVKGHSGDFYNEMCDTLCNDAMRQRNNSRPQYCIPKEKQEPLVLGAGA